jgi:hypothetical protein
MRIRNLATITAASVLALSGVLYGCSGAESDGAAERTGPSKNASVVTEFVGTADLAAGVLSIRPTSDVGIEMEGAWREVPVEQNGEPGLDNPNRIELVTEIEPWIEADGCVYETEDDLAMVDSYEAYVTIRSSFDTKLSNVVVVFDWISDPGKELCYSDGSLGDEVVGRYGTVFYEDLDGYNAEDFQHWIFKLPNTANFTFRGRVLAEWDYCTDGKQNNGEEDVDCGGSCAPCQTHSCTDGEQNGDEEGVDCGGSCPNACPSCTDGEQNGDEEGVDCGGSCPVACPTCSDGEQNGDEEGVDCGGSCPTPCGGDKPACDVGGWRLTQYNSTQNFTIPAGTTIPANGILVIGRNADAAAFWNTWGRQPDANVVYVNSGNKVPQLNGDEVFDLFDAEGTLIDGTTGVPVKGSNAYQRLDAAVSAAEASNWRTVPAAQATPGSSDMILGNKGPVISEIAENSSYIYEFVEIFCDRG